MLINVSSNFCTKFGKTVNYASKDSNVIQCGKCSYVCWATKLKETNKYSEQ